MSLPLKGKPYYQRATKVPFTRGFGVKSKEKSFNNKTTY